MTLQGTIEHGYYQLSVAEAEECGCYVAVGFGGLPEFDEANREMKSAVKELATTQGHRIEMHAPDDGKWTGYLMDVIEPVDDTYYLDERDVAEDD